MNQTGRNLDDGDDGNEDRSHVFVDILHELNRIKYMCVYAYAHHSHNVRINDGLCTLAFGK